MIDYTPTTEQVKKYYDIARIEYDDNYGGEAEFDRWLESVRAQERERIIHILKNENPEPMPAWDLYVRAIEEILEENA